MKSKINWELEFDKFLLENKAFDEFYMERCYYCIIHRNYFGTNDLNLSVYVSRLDHHVFILNAFYFYITARGITYWQTLNNKWLKRIDELNKSPA